MAISPIHQVFAADTSPVLEAFTACRPFYSTHLPGWITSVHAYLQSLSKQQAACEQLPADVASLTKQFNNRTLTKDGYLPQLQTLWTQCGHHLCNLEQSKRVFPWILSMNLVGPVSRLERHPVKIVHPRCQRSIQKWQELGTLTKESNTAIGEIQHHLKAFTIEQERKMSNLVTKYPEAVKDFKPHDEPLELLEKITQVFREFCAQIKKVDESIFQQAQDTLVVLPLFFGSVESKNRSVELKKDTVAKELINLVDAQYQKCCNLLFSVRLLEDLTGRVEECLMALPQEEGSALPSLSVINTKLKTLFEETRSMAAGCKEWTEKLKTVASRLEGDLVKNASHVCQLINVAHKKGEIAPPLLQESVLEEGTEEEWIECPTNLAS